MEPVKELKAAFRTIMYHNYHAPVAEQPIFTIYPEECIKIEKVLNKLEELDQFIFKHKDEFPSDLLDALVEITVR